MIDNSYNQGFGAEKAKLRSLRLELEKLLGIDVDISIILKDGPFDNGPMIKLP